MKYNINNKPLTCMMTQSTCYRGTSKMKPVGVLWHSTGANNTTLKRYVQPDDNAPNRTELLNKLGKNIYKNDWNHVSVQAGLNCWIGKLEDGTVTTVQTMPWDYRPWGCGSGSRGSCNNGWIQFEICEDNLSNKSYFEAVYKEACEITAYLCDMYDLDPKGTVSYAGVKVPVILCHADSHKLGLGSGHGDVLHWFKKYGKTMDDVRRDVAALMSRNDATTPVPVPAPVPPKVETEQKEEVKPTKTQLYRVRKSWDDPKSQIGAFTNLQYAKDTCDKAGKEYHVYDEAGKNVYPTLVKVKVTTAVLNVRKQPTTSSAIATQIKKNEVYTIVEKQGNWGKLKSGAGWICLDYTKEI